MDLRSARRLLALALAVESDRGHPDDGVLTALRAAADDVEPAALALLDDDPAAALELVGALAGFWQDEGLVERGRALTVRVLDAAGSPSSRDAARGGRFAAALAGARLAASELAFRQGDQEAATSWAHGTIEAARAAGDHPRACMAWLMLARVAFRDGAAERIEQASRTALELAPADPMVRRGVLHMTAWAAHTAGDMPEARRRFEASLAYRREIGAGPLSEAVEVGNIAELDLGGGDLVAAANGLRMVVETAASLDNRYLLVNTLPTVATLAAAAGSDAEAAELFGAADAIAEAFGLVPDPGGEQRDVRTELEELMGERAFEAARERGVGLTEEAAVDRAMDVCDVVARSRLAAGSGAGSPRAR